MIRSMTAVLALLAFASITSAATLAVNGIPSFDPALGTLTKATVTINPIPAITEGHNSFAAISSHSHFVQFPAAQVAGLSSFPFATVATSNASGGVGGTHDHSVDLSPSVKVFMGAQLNWFLDQNNGVSSIAFPTIQIQGPQSHTHELHLTPAVPMTVFVYTPAATVPEPTSLVLISLALLLPMQRRRRSATC